MSGISRAPNSSSGDRHVCEKCDLCIRDKLSSVYSVSVVHMYVLDDGSKSYIQYRLLTEGH